MGNRRYSRELVVQFLYLTEMNEGKIENQLKSFWENNSCQEEDVRFFTEDILRNIFNYKEEIDIQLEKYSDNWTLSRMAVIDRNLLRMAASELMYSKVPPKVVIDEAVEIAKKYGTVDSPNFINGVLDRVLKELRPDVPLKPA